VAAAAGALSTWRYLVSRQPGPEAVRFLVNPPAGWSFATSIVGGGVSVAPLALSPDGRRIAFVATAADAKNALWIQPVDRFEPQQLPGTEGAASPFWSPDSRFVAFFADGKIKRSEIGGGPPLTICDAPAATDGTWGDGVILFAIVSVEATPLRRVSASGGVPTVATTLEKGDTKHVRPTFLPDGRHFLYRFLNGARRGPIYLASLDSSARAKILDADSTNVAYSHGHLLFTRETTLMAQPFDAEKGVLSGEPFPVAESVRTMGTAGATSFSVFAASAGGTLVFQTGPGTTASRLMWTDRSGKTTGTLGEAVSFGDVSLSPDGRRIALTVPDPALNTRDIWLIDAERGVRTRFTFDGADDLSPVWSPDGSRIAFASRRGEHLDVYVKPASGVTNEQLLFADDTGKVPTSWSPDGSHLLLTVSKSPAPPDVYALPLNGEAKPFPVAQSPASETLGQFSPDGRHVVFQSSESGRQEVYAVSFPTPGGKWQVSTQGGYSPRWRTPGEILFVDAVSRLSAVGVRASQGLLELDAAVPLFSFVAGGPRSAFDVGSGGKRFLLNNGAAEADIQSPLRVELNWFAGRQN
jgi:eukaryotic-like serine/threonine-protein kinase